MKNIFKKLVTTILVMALTVMPAMASFAATGVCVENCCNPDSV